MSSDEDNESEDDDMSDDSEEPKIERVKEIPAKSFIQELSSVSDSEDEKKDFLADTLGIIGKKNEKESKETKAIGDELD